MSDSPAFILFQSAWHAGKIVIVGTLAEGPDAGGQVVCLVKRETMLRDIDKVRARLSRFPGFLDSVRAAIKAEAAKGVSRLTPKTDKHLMADLAIMMCAKLMIGDESPLEQSGLFSLMIAVSPEDHFPWDRRGFLSAPTAGVIQ